MTKEDFTEKLKGFSANVINAIKEDNATDFSLALTQYNAFLQFNQEGAEAYYSDPFNHFFNSHTNYVSQAIYYEALNCLNSMVKKGDTNFIHPSALHEAARWNKNKSAQWLLEHGVEIDRKVISLFSEPPQETSALYDAAENNIVLLINNRTI